MVVVCEGLEPLFSTGEVSRSQIRPTNYKRHVMEKEWLKKDHRKLCSVRRREESTSFHKNGIFSDNQTGKPITFLHHYVRLHVRDSSTTMIGGRSVYSGSQGPPWSRLRLRRLELFLGRNQNVTRRSWYIFYMSRIGCNAADSCTGRPWAIVFLSTADNNSLTRHLFRKAHVTIHNDIS